MSLIFLASCLILFLFLCLLGLSALILKYIWVFLPVVVVLSILGALFYIEKIVFDKKGMTFQRKFRPITIREITVLEIIRRGGAEGLKITGLTLEGRKIRKNTMSLTFWGVKRLHSKFYANDTKAGSALNIRR